MSDIVTNARISGKIYYGLHFAPGVAEYHEAGKEPYRIMLEENVIKNMDATFAGKPVYVHHVDDIDLDQADGCVVESFFNKLDGKHWVKFIIQTDKALQAIKSGWKLSNAYVVKGSAGGGLWHGVEYEKEVTSAEYEHLAIVPSPRYEESIILDADSFKLYNEKKELELKRLANSKDDTKEKTGMFNFFKKTKVENTAEFEDTSVTLPESKKEVTVSEAIKLADAHAVQNMSGYANDDHMVKVGEEEMSVGQLVKAHNKMMAKNAEDEADMDAKKAEAKGEGEKEPKDKKENELKKEDREEKEKKQNNFDTLKHAEAVAASKPSKKVDLITDKIARGKSRYGSK